MKGLSFSWKRAAGISGMKTKVARATGIPTTRQGVERKVGKAGKAVINTLLGNNTKKKK